MGHKMEGKGTLEAGYDTTSLSRLADSPLQWGEENLIFLGQLFFHKAPSFWYNEECNIFWVSKANLIFPIGLWLHISNF